jgi:hypothetical protein
MQAFKRSSPRVGLIFSLIRSYTRLPGADMDDEKWM